ncbi:MAG TPA: hypothetical protein VN026_01245 [Bacteroidia bacterium]|jgi:hypothetical protein|nr:hypothetical protein [Bacteroidia bacterium]
MKKQIKINLILMLLSFICCQLRSQDLIIKTNGDTLRAKITEVGTNAVSYKKATMPDGPTFVEFKSDVVMIKYGNGEIQKFSKTNPINTGMPNSATTSTNPAAGGTNTANTAGQQSSDGKNKIEKDGNKYTINGKKAKAKDVDKLLGKSKNPLVLMPLKLAKITRKSQKVTKITGIFSSIGGGFTTVVKVIDLYNDVRRGRDNSKTYVNFGLSLAGTLALPITSKILKKNSDKMYEKIIDAYNMTN